MMRQQYRLSSSGLFRRSFFSHLLCVGLFFLFLSDKAEVSLQKVLCQIRIQSPKSLIEKLRLSGAISEETGEVLLGSTASFGTPAYGTILRGKGFYVEDPAREGGRAGGHCTPEYCEKIKNDIEAWKQTEKAGGLSNAIVFLDRGVCTFATKIRLAEKCGADAAVVVDRGVSDWPRSYIRFNVIMSDDGTGHDIHIPSVLIAKDDGEAIVTTILEGGEKEPVLLEMEWRIPNQWPVVIDFWNDPGDS
ncbi:vacuolar sorting receptor, partial [Cystoisospora suis]